MQPANPGLLPGLPTILYEYIQDFTPLAHPPTAEAAP